MIDLTGKNVLITGSTGLLGKSLAIKFSAAGAAVFLHSTRWDEGRTMWAAKELTYPYQLLEADLKSMEEIASLFASIPCPDVIINNAGIQDLLPITDLTRDHMLTFSEVNLFAPMQLTSLLAKAVPDHRDRSVINILSIEADAPARSHAMYDATKGALLQFTRSAALELGSLGIRVNGISPGVIHREGIEEAWPDGVKRFISSSPLGRLVSADEVSNTALFLASTMASAITGVNIRVDAGVGVTSGY